jgi:hypothetical protein
MTLNVIFIIPKALNDLWIVSVFGAQLPEALVRARAIFLDALEYELAAPLNLRLITRIPWFAPKVITCLTRINK